MFAKLVFLQHPVPYQSVQHMDSVQVSTKNAKICKMYQLNFMAEVSSFRSKDRHSINNMKPFQIISHHLFVLYSRKDKEGHERAI